jgi:hypothetical protein
MAENPPCLRRTPGSTSNCGPDFQRLLKKINRSPDRFPLIFKDILQVKIRNGNPDQAAVFMKSNQEYYQPAVRGIVEYNKVMQRIIAFLSRKIQ